MEINIDEYFTSKKANIEKEQLISDINNYDNNYEYKVSLLNIDSRFRNRTPKNIVESNGLFLDKNPISIYNNSSVVKIYNKNHSFKIGDKFILQNVSNNMNIYRKTLYLLNGFDYLIIYMNNHNLTKNTVDYKIKISNYDNLLYSDRMIGNIPINSIINIHNIYLLDSDNDDNISNDNVNKIIDNLNISKEELYRDYFFVKLPFTYSNENKVGTDYIFNSFHNIDMVFRFQYKHIGGVDIKYLNANYPINNLQYSSSFTVYNMDVDNIYFDCGVIGIYDDNSGGEKVIMSKVINTIEGYPDSNNYTVDLKKSFNNVVRIEMVTSEIPYVYFNIINSKNNKIYWKYYEDGDYTYSTTLNEGNYEPSNLILKLKENMNAIERIASTNANRIYNLFDISFDISSQEIKFFSYKRTKLPNSLTVEKDVSLGTETFKLIIKQTNNFVSVGDSITITNAQKIGDIPASIINKTHTVYEINDIADTYTVLINTFIDKSFDEINLVGTGGGNIFITIPARVSFLFDKSDTIGSILGFKNVGSENSVTKFSSITSNFDDYIEPTIYDEVGNDIISNDLLNLNGNNYYMNLYINDYEGVIVNGEFDNPFSKILLTGNAGDVMFNTFVNSPLEFDNPIASINQLKIKFLFPDGSSPDFRNYEHSFTLRIVERTTQPHRTKVFAKNMDYVESMIDYYNNN
jgi:hypothetical protein